MKILRNLVQLMVFIPLMSCEQQPQKVAEIESVDWLPESASEIYHVSGRSHRAFEFLITEEAFHNWIATDYSSLQVTEIREPVEVVTYRFYMNPRPKAATVEVSDGLWGSTTRLPDGSFDDGGYDIVFDRKTSKAYYWWQSH